MLNFKLCVNVKSIINRAGIMFFFLVTDRDVRAVLFLIKSGRKTAVFAQPQAQLMHRFAIDTITIYVQRICIITYSYCYNNDFTQNLKSVMCELSDFKLVHVLYVHIDVLKPTV